MSTPLDQLIDQYLAETYEEFPEYGTSLGLDGYDDRLSQHTEERILHREERTDHWEQAFAAIGDDGLTLDQQIDRDLVLGALRGSQVMRDWAVWKRNPATYLNPGLNSVFTLFLYRLHPDTELAASAASRMKQVPAILEAGKANLDASMASQIFVERAIGQCRAGVSYFRNIVPTEVPEGADRELLAEAGEIAARAHEDFLSFLESLQADARGEWAIGEERYSNILRIKEGLSYGAREMHERGLAEFDALDAEMARRAKDLRGSTDWHAVLEELKDDHPSTPEEMRANYEEWTERARQFLIDRQLVTMPAGEECRVVPSPPFQRPVLAVASYNSPPAFKPTLTGHFFVPFPPDGSPPDDVRKRLRSNSNVEIPTVSVHEAYPGHHWHLITAQANPRVARKVFGTSYFAEGWALYAERMMLEEGFYDDPRHELGVAEARIFRAARIVVDTALHTGEMTFDDAVKYMMDNGGLSEPTAKAEVGRYCSWPTQAPSYLTGALEIERMRGRWLQENPGDLRGFHDKLCGSGTLPIALAERALFG